MVPRKSYRDYNADIYLNTPGPVAAIGPKNWLYRYLIVTGFSRQCEGKVMIYQTCDLEL